MAEFLQQCGSWGVLATLAAYAAGVWVNRKTGKALFNPLLMGSIFMIVFLSCFGVPYADYKSSAQPVSWLLMPATVSLAIPLYEKWELLEKNLAAIFASIAAGVLTSLGSVLAMAWLLKLERAHAVSFLPKSVTTAIGMDVAETLGGTAALAGAVIILTGIVGSLLGETVCKICHITDPLAKGLALGTSAHAIGTSKALQMGEVEGAMSGLAIAVAGIMTAILAHVAANPTPRGGVKTPPYKATIKGGALARLRAGRARPLQSSCSKVPRIRMHILAFQPHRDPQRLIDAAHIVGRDDTGALPQTALIQRADLLGQNDAVLGQPAAVRPHADVRRQAVLVLAACDGCRNDRGAVPVADLILNDKYRTYAPLLGPHDGA